MEEKLNYSWQVCQDIEATDDFKKLHCEVVNMVLKFCRTHDIDIDNFCLTADCVRGSIPYERWQACTDSSFAMYQSDGSQQDKKPYLWSI